MRPCMQSKAGLHCSEHEFPWSWFPVRWDGICFLLILNSKIGVVVVLVPSAPILGGKRD